jgi:hypothetical protein
MAKQPSLLIDEPQVFPMPDPNVSTNFLDRVILLDPQPFEERFVTVPFRFRLLWCPDGAVFLRDLGCRKARCRCLLFRSHVVQLVVCETQGNERMIVVRRSGVTSQSVMLESYTTSMQEECNSRRRLKVNVQTRGRETWKDECATQSLANRASCPM